ncbi:hypothetical protein [Spiroplasma endosymbiont of Labia minor]|uniref:hypothetical protein n=1 Tax=Spiroplasma endosymbiont of Labia minor TaxID=3066305 RepID=UPI0030CD215D
MKNLLSILTIFGLTLSSTTSIISCSVISMDGNGDNENNKNITKQDVINLVEYVQT